MSNKKSGDRFGGLDDLRKLILSAIVAGRKREDRSSFELMHLIGEIA